MRSIKKGNPQNDEKMRSINIYYFLQRQIFYYQKLSVPLPFQIKSFIFGFWRIRIQAVMGLSVVHSQSEILTQMKILQRGAANGSYPRPPFPPKTIITQKSYSASSVVPLWGTLYTTFIFELYSLHYGKHTYVYIYSVWLCMLRHFFSKKKRLGFFCSSPETLPGRPLWILEKGKKPQNSLQSKSIFFFCLIGHTPSLHPSLGPP